jgi:hypothetical protein
MGVLKAVEDYERRVCSARVLLDIAREAAELPRERDDDEWFESHVPGAVYPDLGFPGVSRSTALLFHLLEEFETAGVALVKSFQVDSEGYSRAETDLIPPRHGSAI